MIPASIGRQFARLAYAHLVPFSYRVAFRRAYFSREASTAYKETRAFLMQTAEWDAAKWADYQIAELNALLQWAAQTVPFWQRWARETGWTPASLRTVSDLSRLPTLSKTDLQERLEDYTSQAVPTSRKAYATTGGSTGTPVGFFEESTKTTAKEHAYLDYVRGQLQCTERYRHVLAGGAFVGDPARGRVWDANPIWNELSVSSYHLDEEHLPLIWSRMLRFRPLYIEGYSSALTQLAEYAASIGATMPTLRAVFARSENLYPYQRECIARSFQVPVLNWYGHAEKATFAAECPAQRGYHIFPSYGLLELVDRGGTPITAAGQVGEIVATGFLNRATVFIRYRTEDLACWATGDECACGQTTARLARIDGRLQEFVIGRTGRLISTAAINFHNDVFDRVQRFQFHQDSPGMVTLRIVPRSGFTPVDMMRLQHGVGAKLGTDIRLEIQVVDRIALAPSGKQRLVIQQLPVPAWSLRDSEPLHA